MSMNFTINAVPPTYNKQLKIAFNIKQVYLSKEAKDFKKLVSLLIPPMTLPNTPNTKYKLTITIVNNWYTKKGTIRRHDIQNLDKLLVDCIAQRLGFDDSQIFEEHLIKEQSQTNRKTKIRLEVLNGE